MIFTSLISIIFSLTSILVCGIMAMLSTYLLSILFRFHKEKFGFLGRNQVVFRYFGLRIGLNNIIYKYINYIIV